MKLSLRLPAVFAVVLASTLLVPAQVPADSGDLPAAATVVDRSIAHHDPEGRWGNAGFEMSFRETRPDGSERRTRVRFNDRLDAFEILTQREEAAIEGLLAGDDCVLTLDGSTEFSDQEAEKYRLTCERIQWLRNYYTYLWGMPMKLRDPGTRVDPEVTDAWYQERQVLSVRVTYDEAVGSDTWYFYFDPQTYALVGYRFYHDEAANDGEYIVLKGETEAAGMRIPTTRSWFTNAEGRHLGDDILAAIDVSLED